MTEYRLFYPKTSHDLRQQYPELSEYDEFKRLSGKELLLVWYYACKSSPLDDVEDQDDRMRGALRFSRYKDGDGKNSVDDLKAGRIKKDLNNAISKMSSFQVDMRVDAMLIVARAIDDAKDISNEDWRTHAGDATKLKAFITMKQETAKSIMEIVKMCESQFGLTRFETKEDGDAPDFEITDYITDKKTSNR